jgi:acyl dehydratase
MTNEPYKTTVPTLGVMSSFIDKELGLSDWTEIKQEDINTFARITDDEQWIHIDVERSKKESPYKTTIAHGFMVLGLASKFCYETFHLADAKMGVNYGLDKVRFMSPTPSGAKVRGRVSLMSVDMIEGGAKYKMKVVFELKGQEKPACVAEFLAMAYN